MELVGGRIWIGGGKLEFQERGQGRKLDHDFSVACASVLDLQSHDYRKNFSFPLLIGKKEQTFSTDSAPKRDEAVSLIKTICEPDWFQRGSKKK